MKRNVWIYGGVLGSILCINMIWMVQLMFANPDFRGNEILGYAAMVLVFSLVFFGIKNYRQKLPDQKITFGRAFRMGLYITLVASTMYVVVWLFYYYLFVPDFLDQYIPIALNQVDPADLPAKTQQMEQFREMYKNPLFVILITFSEVLPVGLLVTLVSALVLRRG